MPKTMTMKPSKKEAKQKEGRRPAQVEPKVPSFASGMIEPWRLTPLGHLFDDMWSRWPWGEPSNQLLSPNLDVSEDEDGFWISAEVPGLTRDDVKIQLENGVLTLSGEKISSREEQGRMRHVSERRYGRFSRSISLPPTVEDDKIEAHLENGLLQIHFHKREEAKPRVIPVK